MARRIETEAGVLTGKVDRVARKVVWGLECPECGSSIPLDAETFSGKRAIVCECHWKSLPVAERHVDWPDRSLYFDFTVLWDRKPDPSGLPSRSGLDDLVESDRL